MIKTRHIDPLESGLRDLIQAYQSFQKRIPLIPETAELNIRIADGDLSVILEYVDLNGIVISKSIQAQF